jgi:16S rRNA (adenine1518-N6/adenine1519-N6)-dimethyltransferase
MDRTRELLAARGLRPKKRRGQHFLSRDAILERIAAAARVRPGETVIEIGPGTGNLTRHLLAAGARVTAIEVDPDLVGLLRAEISSPDFTLIEADALEIDYAALAAGRRVKLAANLPFNITTPLLFKFLDARAHFSELLLLIQREVARRIVAPPGGRDYGIVSVQAQLLFDCELLFEVGSEAFTPRPRVSSALIRLTPLLEPRFEVKNLALCRRVIRAAFAKRRKTLRNSFGPAAGLPGRDQIVAALIAAGIEPGRRPETVSVEEFARLSNRLAEPGDPHA